jgi:hypothetical protein
MGLAQDRTTSSVGGNHRTMQMEALAMTGAKLREVMHLLRRLKQQHPGDSDELLQQRFRKELERGP